MRFTPCGIIICKHWCSNSPWQDKQQYVTTAIGLLHFQRPTNGHFYFLIIVDFATSGALLQWPTIFKPVPTWDRSIDVLEDCVGKQRYVSHMNDPHCTLQWLPISTLWHTELYLVQCPNMGNTQMHTIKKDSRQRKQFHLLNNVIKYSPIQSYFNIKLRVSTFSEPSSGCTQKYTQRNATKDVFCCNAKIYIYVLLCAAWRWLWKAEKCSWKLLIHKILK